MKRRYSLENLECAACASKMEDAISRLDGVKEASIQFMTQKLTIEYTEGAVENDILSSAQKLISKFEPDCRVIRK